jgi:hypothetical protein
VIFPHLLQQQIEQEEFAHRHLFAHPALGADGLFDLRADERGLGGREARELELGVGCEY